MPDMNENAETQQEYFGKAKLETDYKDLSMRLYKPIPDLEKDIELLKNGETLKELQAEVFRLIKENAELKEGLRDANKKVVHLACNQNKDLKRKINKAKEIIKTFLGLAEAFGYSPSMDKFITEAEQFIKE